MKIKVKKKLLKESMFSDSIDWKSIDDFEEWNLSQVTALAKYRKGEGDFDYQFYEKVYKNLKKLSLFLNGKCRRLEAIDNHYWWIEKLKKEKLFYLWDSKSGTDKTTAFYHMVEKHGTEYLLHQYDLDERVADLLKLKVIEGQTYKEKPEHFGTLIAYSYVVCSRISKSEKERLRNQIEKMESLRQSYPFKLKYLPTFTKWLGLEESSSGSGAIQGHVSKEENLKEMYSSAGIMGSGSGRIPAERSTEGHKRYVRIRFTRQGLQNFKPNRYFKENKRKKH